MNTDIWHRAYCNWFDHDRAGHKYRAAAWGWVADALCRINDRIGWQDGKR